MVYDGLLCGIFFGHLYATTGLEDQVSFLDYEWRVWVSMCVL